MVRCPNAAWMTFQQRFIFEFGLGRFPDLQLETPVERRFAPRCGTLRPARVPSSLM